MFHVIGIEVQVRCSYPEEMGTNGDKDIRLPGNPGRRLDKCLLEIRLARGGCYL